MTTPEERRRRLSHESEVGPEGRRGCVTIGAILGILLGTVLGIFVLPGVLDSFLAGEEIEAGDAYAGEARVIKVAAVVSGDDAVLREDGTTASGTRIELDVTSRKTWEIEPQFFQLELTSGGDWLEAAEAVSAIPDSSFGFELGESRPLVLQFEHGRGRGEPLYLHLSDPSIRLELTTSE